MEQSHKGRGFSAVHTLTVGVDIWFSAFNALSGPFLLFTAKPPQAIALLADLLSPGLSSAWVCIHTPKIAFLSLAVFLSLTHAATHSSHKHCCLLVRISPCPGFLGRAILPAIFPSLPTPPRLCRRLLLCPVTRCYVSEDSGLLLTACSFCGGWTH